MVYYAFCWRESSSGFSLLLLYFACQYVRYLADPPSVVCLIYVNSKWKYERSFKIFLILFDKWIFRLLLWGQCNLLVDAERYRFIRVGKRSKRGNFNKWYKRENICGFFFLHPGHFVLLIWFRRGALENIKSLKINLLDFMDFSSLNYS